MKNHFLELANADAYLEMETLKRPKPDHIPTLAELKNQILVLPDEKFLDQSGILYTREGPSPITVYKVPAEA